MESWVRWARYGDGEETIGDGWDGFHALSPCIFLNPRTSDPLLYRNHASRGIPVGFILVILG